MKNIKIALGTLVAALSLVLCSPKGRTWASTEGSYMYHQLIVAGPLTINASPVGLTSGLTINSGGITVASGGGIAGPAPAIQLLVAGSTITAACGGTTLIGATGAITLNAATPLAAAVGECHADLANGSTGAATITFPGVTALPAATGSMEFVGATGTAAMPIGDVRHCVWNPTLGNYWSCR